MIKKNIKRDEEWREVLTEAQYYVLRQKGTEPAFSGIYWNHYEEGLYCCSACGNPLFCSESKYNSGTGWPSFKNTICESCTVGALCSQCPGWSLIVHGDYETPVNYICQLGKARAGQIEKIKI